MNLTNLRIWIIFHTLKKSEIFVRSRWAINIDILNIISKVTLISSVQLGVYFQIISNDSISKQSVFWYRSSQVINSVRFTSSNLSFPERFRENIECLWRKSLLFFWGRYLVLFLFSSYTSISRSFSNFDTVTFSVDCCGHFSHSTESRLQIFQYLHENIFRHFQRCSPLL